MKCVNRLGVYGIMIRDKCILLTQKKSGPYKDLWGLPGGAIEFGESPENALKREILEETAFTIFGFDFFCTATSTGIYQLKGSSYEFHHNGILYFVSSFQHTNDLLPEEKIVWEKVEGICFEKLTPFAKEAIIRRKF